MTTAKTVTQAVGIVNMKNAIAAMAEAVIILLDPLNSGNFARPRLGR